MFLGSIQNPQQERKQPQLPKQEDLLSFDFEE